MKVTVSISAAKTCLTLTLTAAVLILLSTCLRFMGDLSSAGIAILLRLFYARWERNIPTWFSFSLLLACALCAAAIGSKRRSEARIGSRYWTSLGVIFLILSMDEVAGIHERFGFLVNRMIPAHGFFYFSWVIVGIPAVLACALVYWRFLRRLPVRARSAVLVGVSLYFGGALGMEMLGGYYADRVGYESPISVGLASVEELLEMLGAIAFIFGALTYMKTEWERLMIQVIVREAADLRRRKIPIGTAFDGTSNGTS